jgi:hypothetical protein
MAFENTEPNINSSALGALAVTPSDTVNLTARIRQITIGGNSGTVSYVGWDGVTYNTNVLPQGSYPCFAIRIRATGTTATSITGWI